MRKNRQMYARGWLVVERPKRQPNSAACIPVIGLTTQFSFSITPPISIHSIGLRSCGTNEVHPTSPRVARREMDSTRTMSAEGSRRSTPRTMSPLRFSSARRRIIASLLAFSERASGRGCRREGAGSRCRAELRRPLARAWQCRSPLRPYCRAWTRHSAANPTAWHGNVRGFVVGAAQAERDVGALGSTNALDRELEAELGDRGAFDCDDRISVA